MIGTVTDPSLLYAYPGTSPDPGNLDALYQMLLQLMGGMSTAGASTPASSASPTASGASSVTPLGQAASMVNLGSALEGNQALGQGWQSLASSGGNSPGAPTVAVLDDFSGSGHGQEIDSIIQAGGANTLNFNVANGGDRVSAIDNSLQQVIQEVQHGQHIDAVNLSQQSFGDSQGNAAVRQKIQELQAMGIPVVVAAGNGGQNALAQGASFAVENSAGGSNARAGSSGVGNIRASGAFTSQATAAVSAQVARLHQQRLSIQQTQQTLHLRQAAQGGSLH